MTQAAKYFVSVGSAQKGHYTAHVTGASAVQIFIDNLKAEGRAITGDVVKIYNASVFGTEQETLVREGVIS